MVIPVATRAHVWVWVSSVLKLGFGVRLDVVQYIARQSNDYLPSPGTDLSKIV